MKVALYLRKSTDEQGDSIDTQRENATRYATGKGWTVTAEFKDSGISRAEFARAKRPGFYGALAAAKRGAVDVILCRDLSRFGGDLFRSGALVQDLLESDARLFTYKDGKEITAGNAMECMVLAFQLYTPHDEREQISSRTREALERRARQGKVAGGIVYGFKNVPSKETRITKRGQVVPAWFDRAIDAEQAPIVVEVFERYARGDSPKRMARDLNERGVPSPRAACVVRHHERLETDSEYRTQWEQKQTQRSDGDRPPLRYPFRNGWVPGTIDDILKNELYRGRDVYNRIKKHYVGGTRVRSKRGPDEVVVNDRPDLRIVPEELWQAVVARRRTNITTIGRPRPTAGRPAANLLSSVLRCGVCGSRMVVQNTKVSYDNVSAYMCHGFLSKLPVVLGGPCWNSWRRPVEEVNGAVLAWLQKEVLNEQLVREALDLVRERMGSRLQHQASTAPNLAVRVEALKAEVRKATRLAMDAPEGCAAPFYEIIRDSNAELAALEAQLRAVKAAPGALDLEVRRIAKEAEGRIGALREVLAGAKPEVARALLLKLFPDGIVAHPREYPNPTGRGRKVHRRFFLEGESTAAWPLLVVADDAVTAGAGMSPCNVASPAGGRRRGVPRSSRSGRCRPRRPWPRTWTRSREPGRPPEAQGGEDDGTDLFPPRLRGPAPRAPARPARALVLGGMPGRSGARERRRTGPTPPGMSPGSARPGATVLLRGSGEAPRQQQGAGGGSPRAR